MAMDDDPVPDHVRRDASDTMSRQAGEAEAPANWVGNSNSFGNESECQTPAATAEVVASRIYMMENGRIDIVQRN